MAALDTEKPVAEVAARIIRRFKTAPDESRIREAIQFVEMLARVEYWPGHNLESPWIKSVIAEIASAKGGLSNAQSCP